jgi:hypothetical protein
VLGEDGSAAVTLEELGEWSHLDALDALVALDRGSAR